MNGLLGLVKFDLKFCIIFDSLEKETNPNAEVLHWLDIIWLKKTVYNKPFVLSSQSNSRYALIMFVNSICCVHSRKDNNSLVMSIIGV